ncbi:MAG: hypothetical protein ACXQT6_05430 [Candidatus Methanospirareceae archaeon]
MSKVKVTYRGYGSAVVSGVRFSRESPTAEVDSSVLRKLRAFPKGTFEVVEPKETKGKRSKEDENEH